MLSESGFFIDPGSCEWSRGPIYISIKKIAENLASIEIWIVAVSMLISMVYPEALIWAIITGVSFWVVRWVAYGSPSKRTPVDISIIILIIMLPVTLWATALPAKTYPQVYRLITGVIIFYSIINWTSTIQRFHFLIIGTIIASLMLAIFALISVEWAFDKLPIIPQSVYDFLPNLVNDTIHRNVMAGTLILILPIPLGFLLFSWKNFISWERVVLIISASMVIVIMLLTQSRGAIIGLGAVLLILMILRYYWGWVLVPISIIGLLTLAMFLGVEKILDFLSSGVSLTGIEGRLEVWSRAIYMIQDFPFTGIGIGSFGDVVDGFYSLFLAAPGSVPHAHNLFLQVSVDLGIPGFIAWLSILLTVIVISLQIYLFGRSQADSMISGVGAGVLCSQVALIVHGITDAVTWGMVRPAPIVWIIWGLAIAGWNIYIGANYTKL